MSPRRGAAGPARRGFELARARSAPRRIAAIGALAAVAALLLLPSLPSLPFEDFASGRGGVLTGPAGGSAIPLAQGTCSKPASVLIPLVEPNGTAATGDRLSVSYEMEVTRGATPLTVYLPRITAYFPTSGGSELVLSVSPNTQTGVGRSWTSASTESVTHSFTAPVSFPSGEKATLSSALLAVMANTTSFQAWNLSMRWQWTLTTANGSIVSPWTGYTTDDSCPSSFYPAPRVNLVRVWNTTGPPGTTFTAELSGYVANQYIFNEIETPSGFVEYSHGQTAGPTNVTNVTIDFDCWCGHLSPGSYLVHIHNVEGSLLWSISIQVTNPDGLNVEANATTTTGPIPLTVGFTATPTPGKPPYSYAWTFGDGTGSSEQDPVHVYTAAGNFSANVTIRDANGATAVASILITPFVPPAPLVVAIASNVTNGTVPLRIHFAANVTGGVAPFEYNWSFGPNRTSDEAAPNETFFTPGLYVVTLNVTDGQGNVVERFIDVTARPVPGGFRAAIVPPAGHYRVPATISFEAQILGGAPPYSATWTFGDGTGPEAGLFANHTYSNPGNYTVTVSVSDAIGDTTNRSVYYLIYGPLTVQLSAAPSARDPLGRPISITANVTGGGPAPVFRWSLNGVSEPWNGSSVVYTPTALGTYEVSLGVSDRWGDQSQTSLTLTVVANTSGSTPPPAGGELLGVPLWEWAVGIGAIVLVAAVAAWAIRARGRDGS